MLKIYQVLQVVSFDKLHLFDNTCVIFIIEVINRSLLLPVGCKGMSSLRFATGENQQQVLGRMAFPWVATWLWKGEELFCASTCIGKYVSTQV